MKRLLLIKSLFLQKNWSKRRSNEKRSFVFYSKLQLNWDRQFDRVVLFKLPSKEVLWIFHFLVQSSALPFLPLSLIYNTFSLTIISFNYKVCQAERALLLSPSYVGRLCGILWTSKIVAEGFLKMTQLSKTDFLNS